MEVCDPSRDVAPASGAGTESLDDGIETITSDSKKRIAETGDDEVVASSSVDENEEDATVVMEVDAQEGGERCENTSGKVVGEDGHAFVCPSQVESIDERGAFSPHLGRGNCRGITSTPVATNTSSPKGRLHPVDSTEKVSEPPVASKTQLLLSPTPISLRSQLGSLFRLSSSPLLRSFLSFAL